MKQYLFFVLSQRASFFSMCLLQTAHTTNTVPAVLPTSLFRLGRLLWFCLLLSFISTTDAQTLVSGNISGVWTSAGNPYIATDNCTIPSGQTLTIQPGVVVWIGGNLSITANGLIQAVGTPSQRITFQAPISSQYWSNIFLIHESGTNRFKYCDFKNARTAISMGIYGGNRTMNTEVANCTFSNCISSAIYGESQGIEFTGTATLNPTIQSCVFDTMSNACVVRIFRDAFGPGGRANPKIIGNFFKNLSGTAFFMDAGSGGVSQPIFLNNTLSNCRVGVDSQEPWDARIQNNIFVSTTNAVMTSGALSRSVSYNCFFGNRTNFTGYPETYGQAILQNRNGTPCDLLFNIFQNPSFVGGNYTLGVTSPCVDAGDQAIFDICFPPSLGTAISDIGAYGGTNACDWPPQLVPPTITVQPRPQVTCVGATVTFNVSATGDAPLNYQWRSNGVTIAGATSTSYTLANVQTNMAADYSVIVSNAAGSDTSDQASLVVAPVCVAIDLFAGLDVTQAIPGTTYRIDYVSELGGLNNWINLTNILAPASAFRWYDPQPAREERRFYRVIPQ